MSWYEDFRVQMPVAKKWAYFDHAAVGPIPQVASDVVNRWHREVSESGDVHWMEWYREVEQCRVEAAKLINASTDEIALVSNTTTGITYVAEGLDWRDGDNLVLPADEFPSNQYPWLNLLTRGVTVRRVSMRSGTIDLKELEKACDKRTRLISLSWVGFAHGYRINVDDAAEIAHRNGALLMLDAIQGLGIFPLDVSKTPVDFLIADGHKWLLGPEGAGVAYIRKENLDKLRPIGMGWNSVKQERDFSTIAFNVKNSASRYEGGTMNMMGFMGLGASLKLFNEYTPANIGNRVLDLTDELCEMLRGLKIEIHTHRDKREHSSGIVSFTIAGQDPQIVRQNCLNRGIVLSNRAGRLRASLHAYNNSADIARLRDALT